MTTRIDSVASTASSPSSSSPRMISASSTSSSFLSTPSSSTSSLPPPALPSPPPAPSAPLSYFAFSSADHFVAGGVAGTVATLLLHPFDTIKVRLQVAGFNADVTSASTAGAKASEGAIDKKIKLSSSSASAASSSFIPRSSISSTRSLLIDEGWRALYKGLAPNLVGNMVAWSLYFFGFDLVKAQFAKRPMATPISWISGSSSSSSSSSSASAAAYPNGRRQLSAIEHILAASITGVCVSAITNPIWVVKTRMILDRAPMHSSSSVLQSAGSAASAASASGSASSSSLVAALSSIYRLEGVAGLYRGFVPGLFGVSHGAMQFMAYEELKRLRLTQRSRNDEEAMRDGRAVNVQSVKWSTSETIAMSILSKSFASFTTYPYQVLRSRLQSSSSSSISLRACISETWRLEGVAGFYRGVWINLIKVMPAACTVFVVYEKMNGYMKSHAVQR